MTNLRLFVYSPPVIFRARVNMPGTITYPLDELTYDTVTVGAHTAIRPGMTLRLGTTAGADDLGRQRVRKVATSTKIPVGRSSQGIHDGELTIVDNAYIEVLDDYRVWSKVPYIDPETGTLYLDSDIGPYLSPEPTPHAAAGAAMAGTIDSVTGKLRVTFDGSQSFMYDVSVTPPVTAVASYTWEAPTGNVVAGSLNSSSVTVDFGPGLHWVHLTVTGRSDGVGPSTHTTHRPVFARDPNNDLSTENFQIHRHRITPQGQEMSVQIYDPVPRATYPDGTLVMIWEGEPTSASSRAHMRFVGWHYRDEENLGATQTGYLTDSVWHLHDVMQRIMHLPGYSLWVQAVVGTFPVAAIRWYFAAYPNMLYYLHILLQWFSSALEVADLLRGTFTTLQTTEFHVLSSDADTIYNQVEGIASSVTPDHHLTCNTRGQLMLVIDPNLTNVSDRHLIPLIDTFTSSDWTSIRYGAVRSPRIYQMLSYAVRGGRTEVIPIAAMSPGDVPGQGTQYIETSERVTFSQFDLNNTEGNRYARMNAMYEPFVVEMPYESLPPDFQPARMAWVQLSIDAALQPPRNLPGVLLRGIVTEATIEYRYGANGLERSVTLQWEMETSGPPAKTVSLEVGS